VDPQRARLDANMREGLLENRPGLGLNPRQLRRLRQNLRPRRSSQ